MRCDDPAQLSGSSNNFGGQKKFNPNLPSTWPEFDKYDEKLLEILKQIFSVTIIGELQNVINDATEKNGSIKNRGHVIAIAQFCAIDVLSSYAFFSLPRYICPACGISDSKKEKYIKFIEKFFPEEYRGYAKELYKSYRNTMIHSWNLFEATILPGTDSPKLKNDTLSFGLINFQNAINSALKQFITELEGDLDLQANVLGRYNKLKKTAKE